MKEYLLGIIATTIALISMVIQLVNELKANRREKKEREREYQEVLSLNLCEQVEYYGGVYRIKIINTSQVATAYNLKASIRIKNKHFNYTYKIPDYSTQEEILSSVKEKDKQLCEIYIRINVMDIDYKEIIKNASPDILKLYEEKKLELKDLLINNENYLAIKYNAVNSLTGKTDYFIKREFVYKDIAHGRFGIGNDHVTLLE